MILVVVVLISQSLRPTLLHKSTGVKTSDKQTSGDNSTKKTKLRTFKGGEFKDLYRQVQYPNLELFSIPPEITGNEAADARIRKLAEARGFVLTGIPISPIVKTNEPRLAGTEDDLLQPLAFQAWTALKQKAKNENIPLSLISAFRSPKWQRDLFTTRLFAYGTTAEQIAAGLADTAVNTTLEVTAVPGYSRHHTGYTIDLWCEDGTGSFATSSCYKWISANNYEKAKQTGWIPSYPKDASLQGPEAEPWEYVWVGTDLLYE